MNANEITRKFGNVYEFSMVIPHEARRQATTLVEQKRQELEAAGYHILEIGTFRAGISPDDVSLVKKFTLYTL